ncbi:hypothetical protein AB0N28_22180 [Streptomyces sp. NPDC051130]|uniref:hypothetical protein n=1 Tax=Streptomyces sp. NPDC051130 TaxID=3157223 RepID=UPI003413C477
MLGPNAASLHLIAEDIEDCGLDAADLRKAADAAQAGARILDEIAVPRLLTGDLWTVNTMLAPTLRSRPSPESSTWTAPGGGDADADWTLLMASEQRLAFFDTYGTPVSSSAAEFRRHVYEARHLGAILLERHRLGNATGVQAGYEDMAAVLAHLA